MLIKFWDSGPIQPAICTVLHAESESEVKKAQNLQPGGGEKLGKPTFIHKSLLIREKIRDFFDQGLGTRTNPGKFPVKF